MTYKRVSKAEIIARIYTLWAGDRRGQEPQYTIFEEGLGRTYYNDKAHSR